MSDSVQFNAEMHYLYDRPSNQPARTISQYLDGEVGPSYWFLHTSWFGTGGTRSYANAALFAVRLGTGNRGLYNYKGNHVDYRSLCECRDCQNLSGGSWFCEGTLCYKITDTEGLWHESMDQCREMEAQSQSARILDMTEFNLAHLVVESEAIAITEVPKTNKPDFYVWTAGYRVGTEDYLVNTDPISTDWRWRLPEVTFCNDNPCPSGTCDAINEVCIDTVISNNEAITFQFSGMESDADDYELGVDAQTTLSAVLEKWGYTDSRKRRDTSTTLSGITDILSGNGCWCPSILDTVGNPIVGAGNPRNDYDKLCRAFHKCVNNAKRCGSCNGVHDWTFVFAASSASGSHSCISETDCGLTMCQCEMQWAMDTVLLIDEAGGQLTVDNADMNLSSGVCPRGSGGNPSTC